jgi:hypothetical protein
MDSNVNHTNLRILFILHLFLCHYDLHSIQDKMVETNNDHKPIRIQPCFANRFASLPLLALDKLADIHALWRVV